MSLNRYNTKRDANEKPIFDMLRGMGAVVYPTDLPFDAILGWKGGTFLAEVKTEKGKLTKPQAKFIETWTGYPVGILRTPDEASEWLKSLPKRV